MTEAGSFPWGLLQRCWDTLVVRSRAEGSQHGVEVDDEGMETDGIPPCRCGGRVGWRVGGGESSMNESMRAVGWGGK